MSDLMNRFQTLPRAGKWAVMAAAVLVAFLIWDDLIMPLKAGWDQKAATRLAAIEHATGAQSPSMRSRLMGAEIAARGRIEIPGDADTGSANLSQTINDILGKYSIKSDRLSNNNGGPLPKDALKGLVGPLKQAQRITADLQFDAKVEDAMAIIAELESSPQIEAISSVRLVSDPARRNVTVRLSLEAWVITRKSTRRARSL